MPRAPSEKKAEAEKLFNKGVKLTDIAKELGVPEGTVRSWKNRGKWRKALKKNECNVANNKEEGVALQKRKRGGQRGNKNAKGGRGNPHPTPPPSIIKHGAYRAVFLDALDEDEKELIKFVSEDEEQLLMEDIRLSSIRERRILKAINKYRNQKGEVSIVGVTRSESKRSFKDNDEKKLYEERILEKVKKGERLPGETYNIATNTQNKDFIIARLEQELSSVQSKKVKAIEILSKIRFERMKIEDKASGNEAVDDWITAVLGGDIN